ncbi:unnamed protein product [Amoebophrya sp. A120]|nr:unnamed protein product [Amoebophrya sp. A120]|eukprot:GSA120T00025498001.1
MQRLRKVRETEDKKEAGHHHRQGRERDANHGAELCVFEERLAQRVASLCPRDQL